MKHDLLPIDTSRIVLPPEILALAERLAENTHAIWMRRRLADGWRLGPRRDDGSKTTPMLVPYDQLPEAEKEYDREITLEALKAAVALGCSISLKPPVAGRTMP